MKAPHRYFDTGRQYRTGGLGSRDMAFAANMARTLFGGENPLRITQAMLEPVPGGERQAHAQALVLVVHCLAAAAEALEQVAVEGPLGTFPEADGVRRVSVG